MKSNKDTGMREYGIEWGQPFCTEQKDEKTTTSSSTDIYIQRRYRDQKIYMYNSNTKEWLTNHFSHELQAAKWIGDGPTERYTQQFRFIDWTGERMSKKKEDESGVWGEKGQRINLIYFHLLCFSLSQTLTLTHAFVCQRASIINQFIIYRSLRFYLLAFFNFFRPSDSLFSLPF